MKADIGNSAFSQCNSHDQSISGKNSTENSCSDRENVTDRHCNLQTQDFENCQPSNTNTNKQKENENFTNVKLDSDESTLLKSATKKSQSTLFKLPAPSVAKAKPNTIKRALQDISDAKDGRLSWDSIKPRDFTYYYITKHNELMPEKIVVELKSSQVPNMKAFIENYQLSPEMVCRYIDELLSRYSDYPNRKKESLTFRMLGQNYKVVQEIMKNIELKFSYAAAKKVLTEEEVAEQARLNELYKDEKF